MFLSVPSDGCETSAAESPINKIENQTLGLISEDMKIYSVIVS